MIDGGLNLENVPLGPLLVNSRSVDFILAVDGRWADESSFRERQFNRHFVALKLQMLGPSEFVSYANR